MNRSFAVLLGSLLASTALAPPASAESLLDAMAAAYNNNPTLLARRAALRATDETVPQALSGWRPTVQVTGEAGVTGINRSVGRNDSSTKIFPRGASLQISQPLYTGGRVAAALEGAEYSVLAGRADLAATEQRVMFDVATAYMDVLAAQAVVELNSKNVEVLKRQLEAAQDRFRVGEITKTDVAQAEARYGGAIAGRVQAAGQLEAARARYASLVGQPPVDLQPPAALVNLPTSLAEAVAIAADENPSVTAAAYAASAAQAGVDQIEGELYPRVSAVASIARFDEQSARDTDTESAEATIQVSVPLYQSGSVYSRVRSQKHTANQRRIQVYETRRAAVEQATAAWETWQASKAQIESLGTQIRAAEIALEGVQREAQVGARTVLDVLDAEQELLEARVNLVSAQRDEKVAAFQLMQAMGRMTAASFGLSVELYDPTEHYRAIRNVWFGTDVELVPERE